MLIIKGGRASGKTTLIVRLSADQKIPIMTTNYVRAQILKDYAKDLGLTIPEPIIWKIRECGALVSNRQVLIDDMENLFQMMLYQTAGYQFSVITTSVPVVDLCDMAKKKEQRNEENGNCQECGSSGPDCSAEGNAQDSAY